MPSEGYVLSFEQFAMFAIIGGFVVCWAVVFLSRFERYTRNRKHFRFMNQFEHVGEERAYAALAERLEEEAEQAQVRG